MSQDFSSSYVSPLHYCNFITQSRLALSTILALLPFVHRGYIGAHRLFLAFHAYVPCDAFLLLFLTVFVAEQQGTVDIRIPSYVTGRAAITMEPEISEAEKQDVV